MRRNGDILENVVLGMLLALGFIVLLVILGALTALPVMLLWNWLIPSIFKLREIGFLEAWGLLILTGLLFKSSNSSSSSKNK